MIDPQRRWSRHADGKPDYAGLLTFAGLPYTEDLADLDGVDVAIIGAPMDELVTDRPGTRFGPRAIRAAGAPARRPPRGRHRRLRGAARCRLRRRRLCPGRPRVVARRHHGAGGRGRLRGRDAGAAGRRPLDHPARGGGAGLGARPHRARPLRHPHRYRCPPVGARALARHAHVQRRRPRPRRSLALRADRPARLLAGRAGVRLAARARDHILFRPRRARPRHQGDRRAGRRHRRPRPGAADRRRGRARPRLRSRHRHARAGRHDAHRPAVGLPVPRQPARPGRLGRGRGAADDGRRGRHHRAGGRPRHPRVADRRGAAAPGGPRRGLPRTPRAGPAAPGRAGC